jgi:tellurite methyltransferase
MGEVRFISLNHNASDGSAPSGWAAYYAHAGLGPPRPTLLAALDNLAAEGARPGHAVDLGCGIGRDALELLRRGWRVTAVDQEAAALKRLAAEARARRVPAPEPVRARLEEIALPPCDLVNASFSLFLCGSPEAFPPLWRRIRMALRPGGRFAGQLLGPDDGWAKRPGVVSHAPAALTALLAGYAVERLEREETVGVTPRGEAKRWDLWRLVLRRPSR